MGEEEGDGERRIGEGRRAEGSKEEVRRGEGGRE